MVVDTGGDLLRQYTLDQGRVDEIIDIAVKLVEYASDVIRTIQKRYNCVTPPIINLF
jgi:hypothetical protein